MSHTALDFTLAREGQAQVERALEALNLHRDKLDDRARSFTLSVTEQYWSTGFISPAQADWIFRHEAKLQTEEVSLPGDFTSTFVMLKLAHGQLKVPKMIFTIDTEGNRIALIFREGSGTATLTNAYARSNWREHFTYGTLRADGKLYLAQAAQGRREWPEVEKFLALLSADPVQAAKTSAAITGRCCYCNTELTDAVSKSHGYGPVCAQNYNLPYGDFQPITDLDGLFASSARSVFK